MLPSSASQSHKATNDAPPQLIPIQEVPDFEEIQELELNDDAGPKGWLRGGFRPQWQRLFMAAPVRDTVSSRTIAVLRTSIPLDSLKEPLANFETAGDKYYLLDSSGKLILDSNSAYLQKDARAEFSVLPKKINDPCIQKDLLEAYSRGRVVATSNVFKAGFHADHLNLLERLEVKANLVTPILRDNQIFGLLIAHHCLEPHAWQQSEINFLTQLAAQLGLILNRMNSPVSALQLP